MEKSDDNLMLELSAGRPAALDELYRRHARKLHVYFSAGVASSAPEDLVHEVFLRVVETPEKFDPHRGSFRTWLFGIARNLAVDLMRRAGQTRVEVFDEAWAPASEAIGDAGEAAEAHEALRDCLQELRRPEEREALLLYYLGEKLFREIGALIGKSTSMAQKLVHTAREKIRGCLERKGVEA